MRVTAEEFTALVEKAAAQLPPEFAELIDNVAIVVEDEPDEALLADLGFEPDEELLGLYQGVPLTMRETSYMALPDQVTLFRGPLCRTCGNRRELVREIRDTLVHELGHYFGLSDDDMPF